MWQLSNNQPKKNKILQKKRQLGNLACPLNEVNTSSRNAAGLGAEVTSRRA